MAQINSGISNRDCLLSKETNLQQDRKRFIYYLDHELKQTILINCSMHCGSDSAKGWQIKEVRYNTFIKKALLASQRLAVEKAIRAQKKMIRVRYK